MALLFYPRGGSSQVVRYLTRFLPDAGWEVRLGAGSLGGPGEATHAATFFAGADLHAVDYTAARDAPDPLAADPPFHPSYEDRPGVPDRVFAAVDDAAYERLVAVWERELLEAGATDADVLHLHHLTPINEAAARAFPDMPVVGHLHGTELLMLDAIERGPPSTWAHAAAWAERMRGWARRCERLFVLSPDAMRRVPELLGVEPERVVWAPNGFEPEGFDRRPLRGADRLSLWRRWLVEEPRGWRPGGDAGSVSYGEEDLEAFAGGEAPVLLYVGRFTAVKRVPLLIRAYARARERFRRPAPLVLLGGYPGEWEGEHPLEAIEAAGARDVFLAGWRSHDELPDALNASDVTVLASVHEQFGQVIVEGMACGLPAIAVDAHGPATIVEPGETGWLVLADDEEAMADAIVEAVDDDERRAALAERAYERSRTRYAWPALAEGVAGVYEDVAQGRPPAAGATAVGALTEPARKRPNPGVVPSSMPGLGEKVDVRGRTDGRAAGVISDDALAFLAGLHREFNSRRLDLLSRRQERQARFDMGGTLDFRPETREIREGEWEVAPAPEDLQRRRVEITGPTDAKTVINALNSGADGFMADFEDSNSPTWTNMVLGQANLTEAIDGELTYEDPDRGEYHIGAGPATLLVRPRGWHLDEKHLIMDARPMSGSLVDAGLYLFRNARRLLDKGSGPYLYVPKIEGFFEARLWNDVFRWCEDELDLERGTIAVTVLIETVPAAFEMEEILWELHERPAALNAGRWDYIFSMLKCFHERPEFVLPDRPKVTMTVPFMRAYTELLVATCHRRGGHAMGGMAAFLPSRDDPEADERAEAKVRQDKAREVADGFDGTWVAHPDFVRPAAEEFDSALYDRPNQLDRRRDDVEVSAGDLLDAASAGGADGITEEGLRSNVNVAIQYISSWLRGKGAASIYGLMEDAATAEIARSQVWQWMFHECQLDGDRTIDRELVQEIEDEELERIRSEIGDDEWFETEGRPRQSREVFEEVALSEAFVDWLTVVAYERLP